MATKEANKNSNDLINIHLFKDSGKYKNDVFVAVNGKPAQIKRGETVAVKAKFAEVLDHSRAQDSATAELMERKINEYREAERFLGI